MTNFDYACITYWGMDRCDHIQHISDPNDLDHILDVATDLENWGAHGLCIHLENGDSMWLMTPDELAQCLSGVQHFHTFRDPIDMCPDCNRHGDQP